MSSEVSSLKKTDWTDRKEYDRQYYLSHRGKILEGANQYYQTHKEQNHLNFTRWRLTHPEKYREHMRKANARIKLDVLSYYSLSTSPQCTSCGVADIDILCLDHINDDGADQRRQLKLVGAQFFWWLKRNNYPAGYQVLCANCNLKKEILRRRGLECKSL